MNDIRQENTESFNVIGITHGYNLSLYKHVTSLVDVILNKLRFIFMAKNIFLPPFSTPSMSLSKAVKLIGDPVQSSKLSLIKELAIQHC